MPELPKTLSERREYYRLDESLMISYSIAGDNTPTKDTIAQQQAIKLLDDFSAMSGQIKMSLSRMQSRLPELITCFKIIDTKINLLAQTVLYQNDANDLQSRRVNISAGGISFGVDEVIVPDTELILQMVLPPDLNTLSIKAQVIKCQESTDDEFAYFISTKYVNINDVTEDMIVRHIMHGQSDQLRANKQV